MVFHALPCDTREKHSNSVPIWYPENPKRTALIPKIALTQRAVDAMRPPASGRVEYFDRMLPGFGLRVAAGGRKSWFVMYRVNGKKVRETIGTLASLPSVADARERARASVRQAQAGIHPVQARRATPGRAATTFAAAVDRYLREYVERNTRSSTMRETHRILEHDAIPRWAEKLISSITRSDVGELIDEIANRGAPVQSNRTLARLKTFFSWALDHDLIETDPSIRVRMRTREVARDRALSDEEIRAFWFACERQGWPFGPLFRLLLLTAQRRDEVAAMEWHELNLQERLWVIPRHRAKNNRAHDVPLSALAMKTIEALPQFPSQQQAACDTARGGSLVFTTNGLRPVSGFSRAKAGVDKHMMVQLRAALDKVSEDRSSSHSEHWILHDLRRTAATGMARLNVPPHVVDKVLNHTSGTIRGVAAIYNRHAYLGERREALEAWGRYVEHIVQS